jgi:ribose 5-phosphate isomerase B
MTRIRRMIVADPVGWRDEGSGDRRAEILLDDGRNSGSNPRRSEGSGESAVHSHYGPGTSDMRIAVASDHAGYRYKQMLSGFLRARGHEVVDFGTNSEAPVDYPDFIRPAAAAVANGDCERGIVLGGSGNGEAMVANRVPGVRCAVCWNAETARLARAHNDANVISIGQRLVSEEQARTIVQSWLDTPFDDGRHRRRIEKIDTL